MVDIGLSLAGGEIQGEQLAAVSWAVGSWAVGSWAARHGGKLFPAALSLAVPPHM